LPGAKVAVIEGPLNEAVPFTMRIQLPANYKIAPHYHTAIEHVTVISGEFAMGMGGKFDEKSLVKLARVTWRSCNRRRRITPRRPSPQRSRCTASARGP
jgi:anti-sigma factor ChrR (cupin superfamily)